MAAAVVFIIMLLVGITGWSCLHPPRRVHSLHPGHGTWESGRARATNVSIFRGARLVCSLFISFCSFFLPLGFWGVSSIVVIAAPPTCFPYRFMEAGLGYFCFVFPCSLVTLMPLFFGLCGLLARFLCCGGEETSKASSCFLLVVTLQPRIWEASVRRSSIELSSGTSMSTERKSSPQLSLVSLFSGCCSSFSCCCCCCSLSCCSFCPDCWWWLFCWCCFCWWRAVWFYSL